MALSITLDDLVIAYRKAKADAFYENGHHTAHSFAEYEADLFKNLEDLQSKLYAKSSSWLKVKEMVGTYTLKPLIVISALNCITFDSSK